MKKVIGNTKDGRPVYSTEYKEYIVCKYLALPMQGTKRSGLKQLASETNLHVTTIIKWVKAYSNRTGAHDNSTIEQSTTAFYQNGNTVRPKKEQYQIIMAKIEKHLKEVQELKQKAIQLIKDM